AQVFAITPPAVPELGNAAGFDFELEDIGGVGHDQLIAARDQLLGMARNDPNLVGVRHNVNVDTPLLSFTVDQAYDGSMGLTTADINET
ncbi:efflux RND transporter permease subunit, partial [Erwinia amylovora]|uniref:efflux RND transporter permease subunit n=1 Tax=Erwinia amylovora TaxID=552 RepID=UPI00200B73C4